MIGDEILMWVLEERLDELVEPWDEMNRDD
jgi:hypothetical protein